VRQNHRFNGKKLKQSLYSMPCKNYIPEMNTSSFGGKLISSFRAILISGCSSASHLFRETSFVRWSKTLLLALVTIIHTSKRSSQPYLSTSGYNFAGYKITHACLTSCLTTSGWPVDNPIVRSWMVVYIRRIQRVDVVIFVRCLPFVIGHLQC